MCRGVITLFGSKNVVENIVDERNLETRNLMQESGT